MGSVYLTDSLGALSPITVSVKSQREKTKPVCRAPGCCWLTKRGACQLHSEADGTEEFAVGMKEKAVFLLHSELNTGGASARDSPSHLGDSHRVTQ